MVPLYFQNSTVFHGHARFLSDCAGQKKAVSVDCVSVLAHTDENVFVFRSSLKKGKTRNIDFQTEEFPIKTLYLKTKRGKTRKKDLIEINGLEL